MRAKTFVKKHKQNEDISSDASHMEKDHEVQMARSDLFKIAKYAIELHKMLKNVSEDEGLEGWVQAKITKSADYMSSVKHYMEYDMAGDDVEIVAVPANPQPEGPPAEVPAEIVPQESIKGE